MSTLGTYNSSPKIHFLQDLDAFTIFGADFYDQRKKTIRPKQRLLELVSGICISIPRKVWRRMRLQLPVPDGLLHSKDSPRPAFPVWVSEKIILPVIAQTRALVQSHWTVAAALQQFTLLNKKISAVAANRAYVSSQTNRSKFRSWLKPKQLLPQYPIQPDLYPWQSAKLGYWLSQLEHHKKPKTTLKLLN